MIVRTLAFAACLAALTPASAAQRAPGLAPLRFVVGADAGAVGFGRLLEQRLPSGAERELRLAAAPQVEASVGVAFGPATSVRIGLAYAPSSLRFRDDTGGDEDALDQDDLADLSLTTVSLTARSGVGALRGRRLSPYAVLGATLGIWSLDAPDTPPAGVAVASGDDTLVRVGATTGVGVAATLSPRIGAHVEVVTTAVASPFSGSDGFRLVTESGETFDEPDAVAAVSARIGISVRL